MIEKHRADEQRHEALFRARADALGLPRPEVPAELRMLDRLGEATDHFLERPITDGRGVMEAYLLLQVIEERAVAQFQLFEPLFREIDPATADVFAEVARDEQRHLRYCHAIARRYAPDEETRAATLERFRRIEAEAFATHSVRAMRHALANDWYGGGVLQQLAWRIVAALQPLTRPLTAIEITRPAGGASRTEPLAA
jgi:hypothetical protein